MLSICFSTRLDISPNKQQTCCWSIVIWHYSCYSNIYWNHIFVWNKIILSLISHKLQNSCSQFQHSIIHQNIAAIYIFGFWAFRKLWLSCVIMALKTGKMQGNTNITKVFAFENCSRAVQYTKWIYQPFWDPSQLPILWRPIGFRGVPYWGSLVAVVPPPLLTARVVTRLWWK